MTKVRSQYKGWTIPQEHKCKNSEENAGYAVCGSGTLRCEMCAVDEKVESLQSQLKEKEVELQARDGSNKRMKEELERRSERITGLNGAFRNLKGDVRQIIVEEIVDNPHLSSVIANTPHVSGSIHSALHRIAGLNTIQPTESEVDEK